jgi:2-aminoadipate transaminase
MLAALARSFPVGTTWSRPRAGFFTWVELPDGRNAARLFETALARERIAFLPGAAFAAEGAEPARSALRLNFSHAPLEVIEEGIARLARAIAVLDEESRGGHPVPGRAGAGPARERGEAR